MARTIQNDPRLAKLRAEAEARDSEPRGMSQETQQEMLAILKRVEMQMRYQDACGFLVAQSDRDDLRLTQAAIARAEAEIANADAIKFHEWRGCSREDAEAEIAPAQRGGE